MVESLYATLHEQPPALSGSPAVAAVDRVIRRALAKAPEARHASAETMAAELRAIPLADGAEPALPARAITRLIVLPFRMLRADPELDFLCFGLADAIATSLVGPALLVRSSAAASRFAAEAPDFKRLAAEADVDLVLTGTLLRAGEQLRVSTQLVEAPSGTLLRSHQAQASLGDVFGLQDELARRIVESFALELSPRDAAPSPDVPKSARAYEFYLRGNEVSRDYHQLRVARDLYLRCVEDDPGFAPAWARLGRCHRVIGKYLEDPDANQSRAEHAFRRALELNPSLPIAHKLYCHLEAERGRGLDAMLRLVELAHRTRNDPELFAGLVLTCRYCGLLDASRAAHAEARRLDPHVPTSVAYTLWQAGDYEAAAREADADIDSEPKILALEALGRRDEALQALARVESGPLPPVFRAVIDTLRPLLEGRHGEALSRLEVAIARHRDPEALYLLAYIMTRLGESARALELLGDVVKGGFWPARSLALHAVFDPLRKDPAFGELQARAESGSREAQAAFTRAGGDRLLGL
jgi:TolB-like protein/Flp pilus assembly protein TadD